jgi:hypothetical protein
MHNGSANSLAAAISAAEPNSVIAATSAVYARGKVFALGPVVAAITPSRIFLLPPCSPCGGARQFPEVPCFLCHFSTLSKVVINLYSIYKYTSISVDVKKKMRKKCKKVQNVGFWFANAGFK